MESMPDTVVETPGTLIAYESASVGVSAPCTIISPEPPMLFMENTAMPLLTATGSTSRSKER